MELNRTQHHNNFIMGTKDVVSLLVLAVAAGTCVSTSTYNAKVKELDTAVSEQRELLYEIRGLEAQTRDLSQLRPEEKKAGAICSKWDCRKSCCRTIWGVTLCEPTCYTTCEAHNLCCDPNACNAIRAADPAYETMASGFRLAVAKGAIRYNEECISLAEGNVELAKAVCSVCGGGFFCTVGGAFSEAEGKCACADIGLPARPSPTTGCPGGKDGGECKSDEQCKCSCQRPRICHAECQCGRCQCLAD